MFKLFNSHRHGKDNILFPNFNNNTSTYVFKILFQKQNYRIDIDRGALSYYNQIFAKNILFDYTKPNKSNVIVSVTYDVISEDIKSDARVNIFYLCFIIRIRSSKVPALIRQFTD